MSPFHRKLNDHNSSPLNTAILGACLFFATLLLYGQVFGHEFIFFDDPRYITENIHVLEGLNWQNIQWAFTTFEHANWHPLTWISHMVDISIFGLNPGYHLLVNALIHAANSVLLLLVLTRMTAHNWKSAWVATLFAVHPLHVESVAWISERKDVLSTLFLLLAIWSYIAFTKQRTPTKYILTVLFFIFGLLTKPMVITFPFVLLLLDYWPLNRMPIPENSQRPWKEIAARLIPLIREKIPFFLLAMVSGLATYLAQNQFDAVSKFSDIPLWVRFANAIISYVEYLIKMVLPLNLCAYYPYPSSIDKVQYLISILFLLAFSWLVLKKGRVYRYLVTGWFWYLGTLVPVIGLVQVGGQRLADRYTYIPLIGIFLLMSWAVPDLLGKMRHAKTFFSLIGLAVLPLLFMVSWNQVGYWRDTKSLFNHALKATDSNSVAHQQLGIVYFKEGNLEMAVHHFEQSVQLNPHPRYIRNYENAARRLYYEKGMEQMQAKEYQKAAVFLNNAMIFRPQHLGTYRNLASAYFEMEDYRKTEELCIRGRQLFPAEESFCYYLACIYGLREDVPNCKNMLIEAQKTGFNQWTLILNSKYFAGVIHVPELKNYVESEMAK